MEPHETLISRFKDKITKFKREHQWAKKIAKKLHKYHQHLKRLFKRFLPKESDKGLKQFANGTRYFVKHPKERQEDILFRLEDQHAQQLTSDAQKANEKVFNDNKSYKSTPEPHQPSDDGLDGLQ